jgi:hypothetical protein
VRVTDSSSSPPVDARAAAAVELARAAAVEVAGTEVGEHLGVQPEGELAATHAFAASLPGYVGWYWAVTVVRAPQSDPTVAEVVLLPGESSLRPPEWVPWSERLQPGDLGVGDLLPTRADDERLEPGYMQTGFGPEEDGADALAVWELGLGRQRVLSPIGRDDAVDRWYSGAHGPNAPIAEAAPAHCASCGFLTLMAGSLRRLFGVCTNEYSPSDGQVVSFDHGCGAHSEASVIPAATELPGHVEDDAAYDAIALHPVAHPPGSIDDLAPPEDLGHS